ncbi:lantibiotic biosynthesis protein [Pseudoalteromonas phenolica]|uniref:Lantibiotic biosynthesis protein n=1 Tax=Pseudoalteromonas phenolica TaxID=161398 RepID=A0A5R9Q184_9GAMM|nr:lanthionine synthetase C family protein [Pseudoalteromonas phenolica]TLX46009.1 lantibiotic biosynthesis protein [Pseudoalteromonas phenolica]
MPTQAIASAEQAAQVREIIQSLAEKVSQDLHNVETNGLLSGLAGHLLFLYNAYRIDPSFVDETLFSEKLEKLQEELEQQGFELSNGLAGQAWVLEYLNQADMEDYDSELLSDMDQIFYDALNFQPWPGEIESVLGLAGYAPYTARRSKQSEQAALYGVIVDNFASVAQQVDDKLISWSQPEYSVYRFEKDDRKKPEFNLGLAHGVPGIIAALIPALNIDAIKDKTAQLVTQSCDWLLTQQNPNHEEEHCYGSCSGGEHKSRLGWCYGDLTIALTLARAGHALDRPSYVDEARRMALKAAKRDAESGFINDAGLCHGFVGLVSIYQLLNQLMPHPELEQAAKYWLNYSLEQYQEKGLEAFYAYNGETTQHYENFGFLMGYAGVGVGFISVLNDDLDWAECLLMA